MAEYWGVAAIAERLHIAPLTVYRWYHNRGLLMYKRHRTGARSGQIGSIWYTNDGLLLAWEIAYAKEWRERVWSAGRKQRPAAQDQPPLMQPTSPPPDLVPYCEEIS